MPSASPSRAGECWPAVKMPSTSLILRPASRTALVIASRCNASWLLWGSVPISSLSSTPTMHTEFESSRIVSRSAIGLVPSLLGRLEKRNGDVVRELGIDNFHGHIAFDDFGIRVNIDQIGQHAWPFLEFDHGEDVGRRHLHCTIERTMQDLKRVELALAAGLHPGEVMGMA